MNTNDNETEIEQTGRKMHEHGMKTKQTETNFRATEGPMRIHLIERGYMTNFLEHFGWTIFDLKSH